MTISSFPARSPHTSFLLFSLTIAYIGFVFWLGLRPIVLLSGAVIVAGAIGYWRHQVRSHPAIPLSSANLLQADIFQSHLNLLARQVPENAGTIWRSVQQQAIAIGEIAVQIAQQETAFVPDLLETLHTVLDLVDQLVQAVQVTQQVQTPRYLELAQQRLQNSRMRLQETHDQLQALRDQIAVEKLERRSSHASVVSNRLQTLIAENEKGILGDP